MPCGPSTLEQLECWPAPGGTTQKGHLVRGWRSAGHSSSKHVTSTSHVAPSRNIAPPLNGAVTQHASQQGPSPPREEGRVSAPATKRRRLDPPSPLRGNCSSSWIAIWKTTWLLHSYHKALLLGTRRSTPLQVLIPRPRRITSVSHHPHLLNLFILRVSILGQDLLALKCWQIC